VLIHDRDFLDINETAMTLLVFGRFKTQHAYIRYKLTVRSVRSMRARVAQWFIFRSRRPSETVFEARPIMMTIAMIQ
jgi:hypothetical protein